MLWSFSGYFIIKIQNAPGVHCNSPKLSDIFYHRIVNWKQWDIQSVHISWNILKVGFWLIHKLNTFIVEIKITCKCIYRDRSYCHNGAHEKSLNRHNLIIIKYVNVLFRKCYMQTNI